MSFQRILEKYRRISFSERDKGGRFERLMQAYLKTDPKYTFRFKNVWMWSEFPGKIELGGGDTGIDLVALTHEGDYWTIQCKCFREGAVIDKPAVDSLLSTSSREFKNENLQTTRFAQRIWIDTNGRKWGSNAEQAIHHQNPPGPPKRPSAHTRRMPSSKRTNISKHPAAASSSWPAGPEKRSTPCASRNTKRTATASFYSGFRPSRCWDRPCASGARTPTLFNIYK